MSPSEPIGVSSETGTRSLARSASSWSTSMSSRFAISSAVGSRPSSATSLRSVERTFASSWATCTGTRIVRAWCWSARCIAWRIHQVA